MRKGKVKRYEIEEQPELKKFILVLGGLIIIIVGIYFFTRIFVTKDLTNFSSLFNKASDIEYTSGQINYEVVIAGNMLSKPNAEYYVMAFSSEDVEASYYKAVISKYSKEKGSDALPVFNLDLNNELNKPYVAGDEKPSTTYKSLKELKFGELTLLRVSNGKVTKFITDIDNIKKEFGI